MTRFRSLARRGLPFCLAAAFALAGEDDSQSRILRFRSGVEMVIVSASVSDPSDRHVAGLEKANFKIFENKVEQPISYFSDASAPLSVGIILDVSASMAPTLVSARNSVTRFLQQGTEEDEYFLITFNDQARLAQDFTPAADSIKDRVEISQPHGYTALYDAVYTGLRKLSGARNNKKALLVVTDGGDNSSRHTLSDLKKLAGESDTQIYVVAQGMVNEVMPIFPFPPMELNRNIIREIAALTGGRAFFPKALEPLDYYYDLIHSELRSQYVLGYIPSNPVRDGKWRKLRIQVTPPEGFSKLMVQARTGYFVPKR